MSGTSLRSVIGERSDFERIDLEHRISPYKCYYDALAGLVGPTIAQLETITGVVSSVTVLLDQVSQLYKNAGYSGDYVFFMKREHMKFHLCTVFRKQLKQVSPYERKDFRMQLAAGYIRVPGECKHEGHALVLKFWTENGEIKYHAADHQFDVDSRAGRKQQLAQDCEVEYFWCFKPIFYSIETK